MSSDIASNKSIALPTLETQRLVLRPLTLGDAADVQRLAGDYAIATTTLLVPHPYPDGAAESWIATLESAYAEGRDLTLAITSRETGELLGAIGLVLNLFHRRGDLGYWVGKPFWGQGYCTEAGQALLQFGFQELRLHRIQATHFTRNPASGRVMRKLGMRHEGTLRGYTFKWGVFEDTEIYALLADEAPLPAPR